MDLRLTSTPLTRDQKLAVVSVADVKAQERVLHAEEDELIASHIEAAYDHLSGPKGWLNGYCLLAESYEFYTPGFAPTLEVPLRPVVNLSSIALGVLQLDGTYAAPASGSWVGVLSDDFAVIGRLSADAFERRGLPAHPRAYRVTFSVGHADAAAVPSPLRQAIVMLAGHFYQNREATIGTTRVTEVSKKVEYGLQALAGRYRVSPDHA